MPKLWELKLHVLTVSNPHNLVLRQLRELLQLGVPQLSPGSFGRTPATISGGILLGVLNPQMYIYKTALQYLGVKTPAICELWESKPPQIMNFTLRSTGVLTPVIYEHVTF